MHLYDTVAEQAVVSCPECGRSFIPGNLSCDVMHSGKGCCHYSDTEVQVPEGTHPMPALPLFSPDVAKETELPGGQKGWESLPFVENDGKNWPLEFASRMLSIPLRDLADLVRITGLKPSGTIRMAGFRRQGRQPRAYPAEKLIQLTEAIIELRDHLGSSDT